jgi:LPS sulfotransferase NodH
VSRPTTFVVLTTQRSGSSWLVDLLNHHPAVAAHAELFRVADTTVPDYGAKEVPRFEVVVSRGNFSTSKVLAGQRYVYLRGLERAHPGAQAVGFKLMYDQTRDHPGLMSLLVLRRARFIHLVRRDLLGGVLSFDRAEQRGRWRYHEGDPIPDASVRADTSDLLRRLDEREREIERFRRTLRRLPSPVIEIAYEDLSERRDDMLQRVLRFLGVAPSKTELTSSLVRSAPARDSEGLENPDEVRAALMGTRFEWLVRT